MSDNESKENSENAEKPTIEVVSDEDWKEKVKAEDAKLDAESASETAKEADSSDSGAEADIADQLPPANFSMLVQMFYTQAIVALGLIPGPDGKAAQEPKLAKHFIDLLAVLEEKTKRNLTGHEANLLENALHELRLGYLEVSKGAKKS